MTTTFNRETAKIYTFPKRPRTADSGRRETSTATIEAMPVRLATTACGEAWYHEAAVEDADRDRKR
jgi:Protein of unknown function (DUF2735)